MDKKELDKKFVREFTEALKNDPIYVAGEKREAELRRQGRYIEAIKANEELKKLREKVFEHVYNRMAADARNIDLRDLSFPQKDEERIRIGIMKLLACCDIIDGEVKDINSTIKRTHPEIEYNAFNDILSLRKMVMVKLKTFSENSQYLNTTDWGNFVNDYEDMLTSKMRKLYNKYRDI